MRDIRGIVVGLVVGLVVSAGVASASHVPVLAFTMSMSCVLVVVAGVWLIGGRVTRR